MKARIKQLGPREVKFAWVKAHLSLPGNEKADELAKEGASKKARRPIVTEGWTETRVDKDERKRAEGGASHGDGRGWIPEERSGGAGRLW